MNNITRVSAEIAALFVGMTCRFEGVPYEFGVVNTYDPPSHQTAVVAYALVETIDGTMQRKEDCSRVYTSSSSPSYSYAHFDWYNDQQLEQAENDEEVAYCDEADCYATAENARYCEHSGTIEHISDIEYFDGEWYLCSHNLIRQDGHGNDFLDGDDYYVYCENDGEFWPMDECHYCEEGGWICGDEDDCDHCGQEGLDRILSYHRHGKSADLFVGASGWLVGFEVEKNRVGDADSAGDRIDHTSLFAYWETDRSCGIEGVTHAYDPIDEQVKLQFKSDLAEASHLIDVPCDNRCGGHINISCQNMAPRDMLQSFRKYAPLWYAVYRNRLTNYFCSQYDKKIEHGTEKYSPVITKSFGIELRLPSRVTNATQLARRFEWVGVTCSAMRVDIGFNAYVKACRDTLLNGAYSGDRSKYAKVLRLARKFRVWMLDGIAHADIQEWV
jgi:hypothetical protein